LQQKVFNNKKKRVVAFVGDYADLHVIYYLTITETKKRKREKKRSVVSFLWFSTH